MLHASKAGLAMQDTQLPMQVELPHEEPHAAGWAAMLCFIFSSFVCGLLRIRVAHVQPHAAGWRCGLIVLLPLSQGLCGGQTIRFIPVAFNRTAGDVGRVHGIDERVSVGAFLDAIRFYVRFIQLATGS
jgi:hypothetical protein